MGNTGRLAFQGGLLIDGNGAQPREESVVVIEGQKIVQVTDMETATSISDTKVIDISGKTIMPGMIDAHVHICFNDLVEGKAVKGEMYALRSPHMAVIDTIVNARTTVMKGVTTIRTAGDPDNIDISVRNAINQGKLIGSRIYASGKALDRTGGHGHVLPTWLDAASEWCEYCHIVDGPDEIRKAIRTQVHAGADYIKVFQTGGATDPSDKFVLQEFSPEELEMIHEEARRCRKDTGMHAHNKEGILNAINAGARSIEHGTGFDSECASLAHQKGVFYVPTLALYNNILKLDPDEAGLEDYLVKNVQSVVLNQKKSVQNAVNHKVKIATGTDAGALIEHGTCANELELLVSCGLSNMEAIICATKNGAELLRLESQIGTIEAGKIADLLVIDGNPLQDITILQDAQRLNWILKEGQPIKTPQ